MFGIKAWFTGPGGRATCARCGREVAEVASPFWGAALMSPPQLWCADCLRETGRTR